MSGLEPRQDGPKTPNAPHAPARAGEASPTGRSPAIERVEILLGTLLRIGVFISVALIAGGLIVTLVRHPNYATDPATLKHLTHPGAAFPHTPSAVFAELTEFRGRAITTLGLLVLIATPIVRVATSVIVYVVQKDWRYVALTTFVLIVLLVSGLLGKTG